MCILSAFEIAHKSSYWTGSCSPLGIGKKSVGSGDDNCTNEITQDTFFLYIFIHHDLFWPTVRLLSQWRSYVWVELLVTYCRWRIFSVDDDGAAEAAKRTQIVLRERNEKWNWSRNVIKTIWKIEPMLDVMKHRSNQLAPRRNLMWGHSFDIQHIIPNLWVS